MEKIKAIVVRLLNRAIVRYIKRNRIRVIAVAGSIGKTSTANAIRTVLGRKFRVHQPKTAYNTNKSVHLEMFDMNFATSLPGWFWTVAKVLVRSLGKADYEVLVIEIGTDHPGELRSFAFLRPEIGVLTAIAPEHMEYFKTIEAVAEEELSIAGFCDQLIFNANAVGRKFVPADIAKQAVWYGKATGFEADNYRIAHNTSTADFRLAGRQVKGVGLQVLGEHSLDALLAAAAVASRLGLDSDEIAAGLKAVNPVKGRMQRLQGAQDSIIIDDSYNASPEACKAALDVLGQFEAPQRIAVLGMMNEMGGYSAQAHREVGRYCDPAGLDLVVTIGTDANEYLAAAAEARGCRVERFANPYEAGASVKRQLKPGAAVLFKGSQNAVFAEEAIKPLLADPADEARLVRQSAFWMERKRRQFGSPPAP